MNATEKLRQLERIASSADWQSRAATPHLFASFCHEILQVIDIDAIDLPIQTPYPPNTMCCCGELIHPDMPYVEVEPDGVLWHGNPEGGGHKANVDLSYEAKRRQP